MKNFLLSMAFVFIASAATAQTFNYQAAARDAGGDLMVSQNLGIQVRILSGTETGPEVFAETWNTNTNLNGVFNLAIGNGSNISGDLENLDWGNVDYFLEIAIDETGGTVYSLIGAQELNVVPMAMTSLQFEKQVGTTNVIQLAQTVVLNSGNITNLYNTSVNHGARILTLEFQNLDGRLTIAEAAIAQNSTDIVTAQTAAETNAAADAAAQVLVETNRALAAEAANAAAIVTAQSAAETNAAADAAAQVLVETNRALAAEAANAAAIVTAQTAAETNASADAAAQVLVETNRALAAEAVNAAAIVTAQTAAETNAATDAAAQVLVETNRALAAEAVNATAIALNTAKETNATHTGEVTGDTVLTIADNAVTSAKIADATIVTADLDVAEIAGGTDDLATDTELTTALAAQALNVSGTPFTVSMFTTASTVGDSQISDNGNTVFVGNAPSNGNLNVLGNLNYSGNLISTGAGNLFLNSWDVYTDANVFSLSESGVAPRLTILPGGNVGINQTNPTQALDVLGNINASGDLFLKGNKVVANDGFGRLEFFDHNGLEHMELNGFNTYFSNVPVIVDQDLMVTQKLGIGNGSAIPAATLDVLGTVKIADGTEGAAKILTSDAMGNATWQAPAVQTIADGSITEAKLAFDTATQTELDLKAPLLNPSFTGNITTIGDGSGMFYELEPINNFVKFVGNNHTKISGKSFVSLQISAVDKLLITGSAITAKDDLIVETTLETPSIKVTGGSLAVGNVLTSDVDGNATWQAPTAVDISGKADLAGADFTGNVSFGGALTDVNLNVNNINLTAQGSTVFDGPAAVQFFNPSVVFNNPLTTFNDNVNFNGATTDIGFNINNLTLNALTTFQGANVTFQSAGVHFDNDANFRATGQVNILGGLNIAGGTTGNVLTSDVSGNATWQAPAPATIVDGSITEAKLAFDTATQTELDLKANIANPNFTGSVGVGTTMPSYIMDIQGTSGPRARIFSNDNFYAGLLTQNATRQYFVGTQGTFEAADGTNSGFHIYDNTAGAQRMVIDANGNMGINNTSPTAKLDIAGTVKIADGTQGASKVLTSDASGNATWQAAAPATIADGSITEAKLAFDTATQTELDLKAPLESPAFTGNSSFNAGDVDFNSSVNFINFNNGATSFNGIDVNLYNSGFTRIGSPLVEFNHPVGDVQFNNATTNFNNGSVTFSPGVSNVYFYNPSTIFQGTSFDVYSSASFGTGNPGETLTVNSDLYITSSPSAMGYVLTTDGTGRGQWQAPAPATIADGSITEAKLAFDTATQTELNLKANSSDPVFTGTVVTFNSTQLINNANNSFYGSSVDFSNTITDFNGQDVNFNNLTTTINSTQLINNAANIFYGPSVEFSNTITDFNGGDVNFNNGQTFFPQVVDFSAMANFNTFQTNFNTGALNILNSPQVAGHVLTDVNGDGNATWQAPAAGPVADGSITEAKLAFDTATQVELDAVTGPAGPIVANSNAIVNKAESMNTTLGGAQYRSGYVAVPGGYAIQPTDYIVSVQNVPGNIIVPPFDVHGRVLRISNNSGAPLQLVGSNFMDNGPGPVTFININPGNAVKILFDAGLGMWVKIGD